MAFEIWLFLEELLVSGGTDCAICPDEFIEVNDIDELL